MADFPWIKAFPHPVAGYGWDGSDWVPSPPPNPTSYYCLSDKETGGATEYYGYLNKDGGWYILELTTTTARYIKGDSDYTTNWTGRALLVYNYFDLIF